MAFQDNTSNNLKIDTILTDYGRQVLARSNGTFGYVKFAVGDDGVDYGFIARYGRDVGRQRIERLTPTFEPNSNNAVALRFPILSSSNPLLTRLPTMSISADNYAANTNTLTMQTAAGQSTRNLTFSQVLSGGNGTIEADLKDVTFVVRLNQNFFTIAGADRRPIVVDRSGIATYIFPVESGVSSPTGGGVLSFTLNLKAIPVEFFSTYGDGTTIVSQITVYGSQSGATKTINVSFTA